MTFEGIEGSGKSTQAALFLDWLRGRGFDAVLTREPGGTGLGEEVRNILLGYARVDITPLSELFLYLASRAQLISEVIGPSLDKGKVVVADRFSDSTYAYQGWGRDLDRAMLEKLSVFATGGLVPDITFVFDLDARLGLARARDRSGHASPDRMEREDLGFHEKVRKGFLDIAGRERRCHVLDGGKPVELLHREVQRIFSEFVAGREES